MRQRTHISNKRRSSGMTLHSVCSEAVRNVTSGTTHASLFCCLLTALIVLCMGAEGMQLVGIEQQIDTYVSAGASTYVVDYPKGIDGKACESIAQFDGVQAAGALRQDESRITLAKMPSTSIPAFEASAGAMRALASGDSRSTRALAADELSGAWLSAQAADMSGARVRSEETLDDGRRMRVAGVFQVPEDGRDSNLGYAVVSPVPDTGIFDQCIVKAWPVPEHIESLVLTSVRDDGSTDSTGSSADTGGTNDASSTNGKARDDQPRVRQLNTSLGRSLDSAALYQQRSTMWMPLLALLGGLALGFVAVWIRRLELSSALHCGMPKLALLVQIAVETGIWIAASLAVALLPFAVLLLLWQGSDWLACAAVVAKPAVGACVGALAGALCGTLAARERDLFRYFKGR